MSGHFNGDGFIDVIANGGPLERDVLFLAPPHDITVYCLRPGMTDSEMLGQTADALGVGIGDYRR